MHMHARKGRRRGLPARFREPDEKLFCKRMGTRVNAKSVEEEKKKHPECRKTVCDMRMYPYIDTRKSSCA
jgi:hypothetical protein